MSLRKTLEKSPKAKRALLCLLSFAGGILMSFGSSLPAPELDMPDENFSDSGYIKIKWTEKDTYSTVVYQLEQATRPDFSGAKKIYEGPDRASFVSGLPDGNYYFRVRRKIDDQVSDWSSAVKVTVEHHSLTMAFSLASVGILVFLLTVGVVVDGVKKDKKS